MLFILEGIEQTAAETLMLVKNINRAVEETADQINSAEDLFKGFSGFIVL